MISLKNVTKKFGDLKAVDGLSLEVKPGEIYGFIGPNGSGKTTTIKMMAGIYAPTVGDITIAGYDMRKKPVLAKQMIGYIPDVPFVYEKMTGREFLHFIGEMYGMELSKRTAKINKLLKTYPIGDIFDGYFENYSRGNKQKLTILAALLHEPKVLLIDEPVVGLDPQSIVITMDLLKNFAKKKKGSVFLCTHTLDIAEKICDRIGILKDGRLLEEGTLAALRKKAKMKAGSLEALYLKLTK